MNKLTIVLVFLAVEVLFSFWTDRTLDFWMSYFKHSHVDVPFWLSFLVTFVGNHVVTVLNIISEIARLLVV